MKQAMLLIGLCLSAGCSELATVHYVNDANPAYGAAATGYRDTDGDGIKDYSDLCPRTRPGDTVNDTGCAPQYIEPVVSGCDDLASEEIQSSSLACDTAGCIN